MISNQTIKKHLPQANIVELQKDEIEITVGVFRFVIIRDDQEEGEVFFLSKQIAFIPDYLQNYDDEGSPYLDEICKEIKNFLVEQQTAIAQILGE